MRLRLLILPLAAVALMGADDEPVDDGAMVLSQEQLAARLLLLKAPEPGQYNTSMELLEFDFPGLDEGLGELLRSAMQEAGKTPQSMCLSEEDAGQRMDEMLQNMAQGECTFSRFDVAGGTLDAAMQCEDVNGRVYSGVMAGSMDSAGADLTVHMNFDDPAMGAGTIGMRVVSERVGDCS